VGQNCSIKVGPFYVVKTTPRLIEIIGSYKEVFFKGRRCEIQGLGIGAFSYYRRVVEEQKHQLIGEMLKVSKKLGAKAEIIARFEKALKETQFAAAVDDLNDVIPESLRLEGGHNPLKLLHTALSKGLHARTDEECLGYATSIRTLLIELAERMGEALKEDANLKSAISKLLEIERS
jgi:hypothetical protein